MMRLQSLGTHDFYMTLDVADYFEQEYDPERIAEHGYVRVLKLPQRDVLVHARFEDNHEGPHFLLAVPEQDAPNEAEQAEILRQMSRVLGCSIDTDAFANALADDPVVAPMLERHEGFKRLSRPDFFDDAVRTIIRTQISHGPTKQRMVRDVRAAYGTTFEYMGTTYWSYPRPEVLAQVEPEEIKRHRLTLRKGEYITGLAKLIVDGELDLMELEHMEPQAFYDKIIAIRGIGPSAAQSLVTRRDRPDAVFPIKRTKTKRSNGMLKWLLPHYGLDLDSSPDEEIEQVLSRWAGWEATVSHLFFYNWLMNRLEQAHQS